MSRYDELIKSIENNNYKGGLPNEKWIVFCLTDIAMSLAKIADLLEDKTEENKND